MACECEGRRVIDLPNGRVAHCECATAVIDKIFIKPQIRGALARYPSEFDACEPYAIQDLLITGAWTDLPAFKSMLWRTLGQFRFAVGEARPTYEYIDTSQLVDIVFERHPDFPSMQALVAPKLLVLVVSPMAPMNKLMAPTIGNLLTSRQGFGRPTWVFAYSREKVIETYPSLAPYLPTDTRTVRGGVVARTPDVSAPATMVRERAATSRAKAPGQPQY